MHADAQGAIIQVYSQRMRAGELNPQEQAEVAVMIDKFGDVLLFAKTEMELAIEEAAIMWAFIQEKDLVESLTAFRSQFKGEE